MQELKCTNCGGVLEAGEAQVFTVEQITIVRAGNKLTCGYCGAVFEQGHELESARGSTQIAVGSGIAQASDGGVAVVFNQSGQSVGSQVNTAGIAIGPGAVAAGQGGVAISGNVRGSIMVEDGRIVVSGRKI